TARAALPALVAIAVVRLDAWRLGGGWKLPSKGRSVFLIQQQIVVGSLDRLFDSINGHGSKRVGDARKAVRGGGERYRGGTNAVRGREARGTEVGTPGDQPGKMGDRSGEAGVLTQRYPVAAHRWGTLTRNSH